MGLSESIDRKVKEYYCEFLDSKCNDNEELVDVYLYTKSKVSEYISQNQEKFDNFVEKAHTTKRIISNMILQDVWYHIYENICFLDIRYNIDQDIENININKAINALEKNDKIGIISLKDFLNNQCFDKNHKRRYEYSIRNESQEYQGKYHIPRTCSVYVNYYSAESALYQKRYLCREYVDIIHFLHNDSINKNDIKADIKSYSIWDIDEDWITEISKFYKTIKAGKNNLLQYQLVERLFKFRTFLNIYESFYKKPYLKDMLMHAQPFTLFGYSFCMNFFMKNYKVLQTNACQREVAELLFNGIVFTINSVINKILTTIWKKKTNAEKQKWIRDIKVKISISNTEGYKLLSEHKKIFSDFDYDILNKVRNITPVANYYLLILFNSKFINYKSVEDIIPDFEEIDNVSDCDEEYEQDIAKTKYSDNFYDNLDKYNGNIKAFFDSIYVEADEEDTANNEWYTLDSVSYDFNFLDLLFLITKCEYKDFFE